MHPKSYINTTGVTQWRYLYSLVLKMFISIFRITSEECVGTLDKNWGEKQSGWKN